MAKHHSETEKNQAISKVQNGKKIAEVCEQYHISRSTLHLWLQQSKPQEASPYSARELYLMKEELNRLRTDNQILSECLCSPNAPIHERILEIQRLKEKYSIHALCRILNVQRSTFYYHELRAPEKTLVELEDLKLKPLIRDLFEKSGQRFGGHMLKTKLQAVGYSISERRISRLMKELHLSPLRSYPKINSANDRQYKYYPNKLKRQFIADAPNVAWVSDITYIKVANEFLYLCVILDLFSRKVIAYHTSLSNDAELVIKTFLSAFQHRGRPHPLIFHSDRGAQYTSSEFGQLMSEFKVVQSFSAARSPHDNAVAESFFASLKKEEIRRHYYQSVSECRLAIEQYIEYYNDFRPHQRLSMLTPNQAEDEYFTK